MQHRPRRGSGISAVANDKPAIYNDVADAFRFSVESWLSRRKVETRVNRPASDPLQIEDHQVGMPTSPFSYVCIAVETSDLPYQRQLGDHADLTRLGRHFRPWLDAELRNPRQPFLQQHTQLGAREQRSNAAMHAGTEGQV